MTTEKSTTKEYKASPIEYKKTTLSDNYMKYPANAVAVGKVGENKGKLLLACAAIDRIIILDPDTGKVIKEYGEGFPVDGALDDVCEGPDGTLYCTHLGSDQIGYIRPDDTHGFIQVKPWNNSIAVTQDGKWLYYGLCIGDDQLWRVQLENGLPKEGAQHELVQQSPGWSNSMCAGADGFIYSPLNVYGEIRKINAETKETTTLAKNVEFPSSCEINDNDPSILYVSEFHLGYISRIDTKIKDPLRNKRVLAIARPGTDNVAIQTGTPPRIFGSSFIDGLIFECFENGDPIRVIATGGMLPHQIHIRKGPNGDRFFIKDFGRIQEWFPAENRYETLASGNFWSYLQDKAWERGVKRYDPERVNWTASMEDQLTIPFGKVFQPTSDGHFLVAGSLFEGFGNRLAIFDVDNRKTLRIVKNLDYVQDAIMVGKDIYVIEGKPTTRAWKGWNNAEKGASKGYHMMKDMNTEWPIAAHITRITPDDKRETVFEGKRFIAFARTDDVAFASDLGANTIYQVVKDGKWMAKPEVFLSGLKGPRGMAFANDGNLLVTEDNVGFNGRLLKVDLKTKEITVLADGLGLNPDMNKRDWKLIFPHSTVAQASDGAIYFTEPGITSLSVLRAQS
jgi:sugar lactone lactonase YvrE